MKKLIATIMALTLVFGVNSYAATEDITEIAIGNSDLTILVSALSQAELVGALKGDGPFTVFAPTNAAFADLLSELNITAEALLAHPDLSKVLLYHVVTGKVMSTDLSNGMSAPTLNGEAITVDLTNGVKINQASVVTADVEAANGVIHIIDKVLVPSDFKLSNPVEAAVKPSIVDIALSDGNFSMLVMLLQKADLVEALQGDGPYTVFAPTNAAFTDLITALGITPDQLMAQPDLAKVLLYHVVSGKVLSTDLTNGLMAPTLNGEKLAFTLGDDVMVNSSKVISADIEASNGVIHVINKILVPADFSLVEVNMEETAVPYTGQSNSYPIILALFAGSLVLAGKVVRKIRYSKDSI